MTGIDISGVQPDQVPGQWEFVVVKLTEGEHVVNPRADQQWAFAHQFPKRGFYHYARPAVSDGASQARVFALQAMERGFRPGADMWQLDAESGLNETVDAASWRAFIDAFMVTATSLLGSAGFLYAGWPFYRQQFGADTSALMRYHWWLPDYGPNTDTTVHPFGAGVPANLVVIHQFTSFGGLDRNRIANYAMFNSLFGGTHPTPPAPPIVKVKPMHAPYTATWVADCDCPSGGAWILTTSGGVLTVGSAPFHGAPGNIQPAGETWNAIRVPDPHDPKDPGTNPHGGPVSYVCVTSGDHRYGY